MSKERQRARAVREAARAEELARAVKVEQRRAKAARLRPSLPALPERRPRQRRFGALPTRVRLGLLFGWLGVQLLAAQVFADTRTRIGMALVSLAALPLVVVLTRDPARRRT